MGSALPADGVRPVTQTDCMHDRAVGQMHRNTVAGMRLVITMSIPQLAAFSKAICCAEC